MGRSTSCRWLAKVIGALCFCLQSLLPPTCYCHAFTPWTASTSTATSCIGRYFNSAPGTASPKSPPAKAASVRFASLSSEALSTQLSTSQPSYTVVANSPVLGGDIIRIRTGPDEDDTDDSGFLTTLGVPTFAVLPQHLQQLSTDGTSVKIDTNAKPKRLGLEAILHNSNAFLLSNALSQSTCESILDLCENHLGFGNYQAGKNNHGAMQVVIPKEIADALLTVIGPHVDLEGISESAKELQHETTIISEGKSYSIAGINRRLRVYRYALGQEESFAPHIDAGFPPGGFSLDTDSKIDDKRQPYLYWDASNQYSQTSEVVSRLTVLIYLNEDFSGGHTKFYSPRCEMDRTADWSNHNIEIEGNENTYFEENMIASIQPRTGSILIFPQAVSEEAVERARHLWPLHEGSPVISGNRPKYVIRTDVLFETNPSKEEELAQLPKGEQRLFQHDEAVRQVFLPRSPAFSSLFLNHVKSLYNPHMGGELNKM